MIENVGDKDFYFDVQARLLLGEIEGQIRFSISSDYIVELDLRFRNVIKEKFADFFSERNASLMTFNSFNKMTPFNAGLNSQSYENAAHKTFTLFLSQIAMNDSELEFITEKCKWHSIKTKSRIINERIAFDLLQIENKLTDVQKTRLQINFILNK